MLARVGSLLPYLLERWCGERGSVTARTGRMWPQHWSFAEEMGSQTQSPLLSVRLSAGLLPYILVIVIHLTVLCVDLFPSVWTEGLLCTCQALFATYTDHFCGLYVVSHPEKSPVRQPVGTFCGENWNSWWFSDLPEWQLGVNKHFNLSL